MDARHDLDRLALALADGGTGAHEHAISRLARTARATGAPPVAVDVLADRAAPEPARLRAFSIVARHLAARPSAPSRAATSHAA